MLCWFLLCNNINQLYVYIYSLSVEPPSPSFRASLVAQMIKNLLAMWETWVQSLGWEDPLEEGMANHSSILPWRIPRDRGLWLHPLPLSHPSRSSQSAMLGSQFHSDFSPAIYFTHGSVNKSVLLSPFTWLSPSSTMCTSVLYILHSFPADRFINTIFPTKF